MKVGDIVKWIGFPGSSLKPEQTGPNAFGMIINVVIMNKDKRVNVMWGDGKRGMYLYPGTLEVVSESG